MSKMFIFCNGKSLLFYKIFSSLVKEKKMSFHSAVSLGFQNQRRYSLWSNFYGRYFEQVTRIRKLTNQTRLKIVHSRSLEGFRASITQNSFKNFLIQLLTYFVLSVDVPNFQNRLYCSWKYKINKTSNLPSQNYRVIVVRRHCYRRLQFYRNYFNLVLLVNKVHCYNTFFCWWMVKQWSSSLSNLFI